MQVARLKAERRTALGRNKLAQLRSEGWMPAVVYGEGKETQPIAISEWELDQHVKAHHRVFHLEIGGKSEAAFLLEVSWHVTSDRPLHADFKRIDLTKPIEAEVEIKLVGHPIGLSKAGVLSKDHLQLRVRCLPTEIPDTLEHDVSKLDMDEYVTAGQIVVPAGVEVLTPPSTAICHVAKLVVVLAPEPVAPTADAAAAAAAAPGAEKASDKGGDKADKGADKGGDKGGDKGKDKK